MVCGRRAFPQIVASMLALVAAPGRSLGDDADRAAWRAADAAGDAAAWDGFRARFVEGGRVVDTGNDGVSHSEGQGYGLIFAGFFDDPGTFDRIRSWTARTLQVRPDDRLHAWRFRPGAPTPIADLNNAMDGDLLIAFGLARAGWRWNRPELLAEARAVYRDVLRRGTVEQDGRLLLRPGVGGFERPDGEVVNPSYLVFPSLAAAAVLAGGRDERERWEQVSRDGAALTRAARFGRWNLPPDWLHVSASSGLAVAEGWPPRFSFDAVRIPLHLYWAGLFGTAEQERFRAYWNAFGADDLPAWIDLRSNQTAPYRGSAGLRAVAACTGLSVPPGTRFAAPAAEAGAGAGADYYSAALSLLARIAVSERRPT